MDKQNLFKLEEQFNETIATLNLRGCPLYLQTLLFMKKEYAIDCLEREKIEKTPDTLLMLSPVIPKNYMGLYGLILLVSFNFAKAEISLNPNELTNSVETPDSPYFIFDIRKAKKKPSPKYRYLTVEETLAIVIQDPDILNDYTIKILNSLYQKKHRLFLYNKKVDSSQIYPVPTIGTSPPSEKEIICPICRTITI